MMFALLLLAPLVARAGEIPAGAFPGIALDAPLADAYATGEALPLKGSALDASRADGQILFRFSGRGGQGDFRLFLALQGRRFTGYQIFAHGQEGVYDLEVFLGGPGAERLDFLGRFEGLRIGRGSGPIELPRDFFRDVLLDQPLSTHLLSGAGVKLAGQVAEEKAGGQILFNFAPEDGGEEIAVFLDVEGTRFSGSHVFRHEQAGAYVLEVFLGGFGEERLGFVGRFSAQVGEGSGPLFIPVDFFAGVRFDQPLAAEWPVGRDLVLAGAVEAGIRSLRLELTRKGQEGRVVRVGVEDGRFRRPLRLQPREVGEWELRLVVETADGRWRSSGTFVVRGVQAPPAPSLEPGALGLAFQPGGQAEMILANRGAAPARRLRYAVEGPFALVEAPAALEAGEGARVRLHYAGSGGEYGLLHIDSDDPLRPLQQVALQGLRQAQSDFLRGQADAQGRLGVDLDLDAHDYVLVLHSGEAAAADSGASYAFAVGGPAPASRPATPPLEGGERDRAEVELRRRERQLAARWQAGSGVPAAGKSAAAAQVGARRTFVFPGLGRVAEQAVAARVLAVTERAVVWVQENLRTRAANLEEAQMVALVERFAAEDYERVVQVFGAPSDVDGDGRLAFLFTHLVDDAGAIAGFYSASSVLPVQVGGNGNMADLMYISPGQRPESYRSLLVHEFQHLINFNQHVLVRGGEGEVNWLNEGLSHLAEDLVSGPAESGQGEIVEAFLADPQSVGLVGEALLDPRKRGAAYLFLRGLVDQMGEGLLLRLVGTGLADRENIEEATGAPLAELLAFWGARLYLSGLGLSAHPHFNFAAPQLRAGEYRGLPLPAALQHVAGVGAARGMLRPRGLAFVEMSGRGHHSLRLQAAPEAHLGAVVVPLPKAFAPAVFVPAEYVPGLRFARLVPAAPLALRPYRVEGQALDGQIEAVLLRFSGADTLRFEAPVREGRFEVDLKFPRTGLYRLEFFLGSGGGRLDFAAGFGPIRVLPEEGSTAVAESGSAPLRFALQPIYPNPFNASSTVPISLPEGAQVRLEIYDVLGQKVRTLHHGYLQAGSWRFVWDGRDALQGAAASGLYLFELRAGSKRQVRRALLLR